VATIIVAFLAAVGLVFSQSIVIVNTNARTFPSVTVKAYSFDPTGALQNIDKGDVSVSDASLTVDHTVTCDQPTSGRALSVVVMCDVSSSANDGTPSAIVLAKAGALAIPKIAAATSDEIALLSFDQGATLRYGLSTDKVKYETAVNNLVKGSGTNLTNGLLSTPMGALVHLQNAKNQRALIIFLESPTSISVLPVLSQARTYRIPIYIVALRTQLTEELKRVADSSGGAWTENVTTVAEAQTFARAYAAHAKNLPGCNISWVTKSPCTEIHPVSIARGSSLRALTYTAATTLLSGLQFSTTGIEFGISGVPIERKVTITARNADVTINSAAMASGPFTLVTPIAAGTVVKKDASIDITIKYTPLNAVGIYGTLLFATDACRVSPLYFHGGALTDGQRIKIETPLEGAKFLAGSTTNIAWSNTLPDDLVRIDVSYDNGTTWQSVAEAASGLKYKWLVGPKVSNEVKFRIQRTLIDSSKIVIYRGNSQPVYDATFINDNSSVVLGGHDGTVRQFNAITGASEKLLGTHSDWVWSVAAHPNLPIVATGSHDATVRIWNYTTGERVATIPSGSRVWCVNFSPDGKKLIIGSERLFSIYTVGEWQNADTTVFISDGPVYNAKYSGTGNRFVITHGRLATIYNSTTLAEVKTLTGHTAVVYTAALNSDGSKACTGGADFTLRIWNGETGSLTKTITPAVGSVLATQYAPDGNKLVASGVDGVAKVYEAQTLKLLHTFAGHQGIVYGTKYNNTGKKLITASTDYTARSWDIEDAKLVEDSTKYTVSIHSGEPTAQSVNFGSVVIGTGKDIRSDVVSNGGTEPLSIISARLISGNIDEFDITSTFAPFTLEAGAKLSLVANFEPLAVGARAATVEVLTGVGPVLVELTGSGVGRELNIPVVVNFGRHIALTTIVDSLIAIKLPAGNQGPETITKITLSGVQSNHFSIVSGGEGFTLTGNQQHSLTLRFQPLDLGKFAAVIEITLDNGQVRIIRLYGEGTGDASVTFSSTGILFETDKCSAVPSAKVIKLRNNGNSSLTVYAAIIDGVNAAEFALTSLGTFPIEIPPVSERDLEITFTPQTAGVKDARLIVSTNAINADNGTSTIPLIARKDSFGFELTRPTVNFNNIAEGDAAVERLLLLNTGTVGLRWSRNPIDLGSFRIESVIPDVTPPGSFSEITVRFMGGTVGTPYSATYNFVDSTCGRTQTLIMNASVRSYIGCTLRAATTSGRTGSVTAVPVYITKKVNFDRTNITTIRARMLVNGTLLTPTGDKGTLRADGMREFTIDIPIPSSDSLATTLNFNTTWGNVTASVVVFDLVTTDDTVLVRTQDGSVLIEDICRQGGPRLISLKANSASIKFWPQPATGETYADVSILERGLTSINMVDINGRMVMRIADQYFDPGVYSIPVLVTGLENGLYFVVMQTPTQRFSTRFEVVR